MKVLELHNNAGTSRALMVNKLELQPSLVISIFTEFFKLTDLCHN